MREFVQLFRILHINQQSHMIFTYLIKVVNLNKRISMLQKWQKSTHYRNSFAISKTSSSSNLCQTINWDVCEKISFNSFSFVQLLRILHFNQQLHMIFIYLVRIVDQNERISMFQKLLKSIHYRNSCEILKIAKLRNLCSFFNFSQCSQRFNAISIIISCALDRFSILLIIWIEFTSSFKTSFRLYILLTRCKCY